MGGKESNVSSVAMVTEAFNLHNGKKNRNQVNGTKFNSTQTIINFIINKIIYRVNMCFLFFGLKITLNKYHIIK